MVRTRVIGRSALLGVLAPAGIGICGCGALLLLPDLLETPSRIDGCPETTPTVGDTIELTLAVIRDGEDQPDDAVNLNWKVTQGQADIADPTANPASITFTPTGIVVILA
ncbi:MAG: hypothetical protein IH895_07615, partial [Planctomycetes bacterium]|nr:hypothetical protein [Planctomycetota bacterium]